MTIRTIIPIIFLFLSVTSHAQNSHDITVGTSFTIPSEIMNDEREIQIFLPEGYADSEKRYPVLYILDGQRYFLHGVSLQKSFVEFKQTPEFIIVGISKKAADRNRNFSTNAQKYLEYIKKEVIGFVDAEYRTAAQRMLFGWAYAEPEMLFV